MKELAIKAPTSLTISGLLTNARMIAVPFTECDTPATPNAALNTACVEDFSGVIAAQRAAASHNR